MTTPREHVKPEDFVCPACGGIGRKHASEPSTYFCRTCCRTGLNLELLADLYNDLSAAVREVQARTDGDER